MRRRGFTIVELLVTMTVIGVVVASVVPTLRWVHLERTLAERRLIAQQEAQNILERAAAAPWGELGPEAAKTWTLSAEGTTALPGARLEVVVRDDPEAAPKAKQVRVAVFWTSTSGRPESPVRITAWFYQ